MAQPKTKNIIPVEIKADSSGLGSARKYTNLKMLIITIHYLDAHYATSADILHLDKADPQVKLNFNGVACKTDQMKNNEKPHFNTPYSFMLDETT